MSLRRVLHLRNHITTVAPEPILFYDDYFHSPNPKLVQAMMRLFLDKNDREEKRFKQLQRKFLLI